ncbi:MAG: DNA helicase [Halomonadaceae bacterium]|nr:MAG: DNA helicase [Halomonadaceae bacterium]
MGAIKRRWHQLNRFYDALYVTPYRRTARRAQRRQEDLFRLLVMSEALGIPNPASFYTLELLPFLMEDFHAWHLRMGMEHSPLEGMKCC